MEKDASIPHSKRQKADHQPSKGKGLHLLIQHASTGTLCGQEKGAA